MKQQERFNEEISRINITLAGCRKSGWLWYNQQATPVTVAITHAEPGYVDDPEDKHIYYLAAVYYGELPDGRRVQAVRPWYPHWDTIFNPYASIKPNPTTTWELLK